MEDCDIIRLYFDRNEKAIYETNAKYEGYCGRIARNILPTQEDTEECLSDTWMRAWNTIPPQEPRSLRAYLGCLARSAAINIYHVIHAQKRCTALESLLGELEECVPAGANVETALDNTALAAALNTWLVGLPVGERRLFLQRYWYGEPLKALAREQGCSANALASRMKRLRRSLKQYLEQEGFAV